MFGALKRGFRSMASLILVRNVVGELQPKRTLAASRGFLAAARLSCLLVNSFSLILANLQCFGELCTSVMPCNCIGVKRVHSNNEEWPTLLNWTHDVNVINFRAGYRVTESVAAADWDAVYKSGGAPRQHKQRSVAILLSFLVFTRDSIYAIARICYRPSIRPSVCLSHGWISQKQLKLGSQNLHRTVAPSL